MLKKYFIKFSRQDQERKRLVFPLPFALKFFNFGSKFTLTDTLRILEVLHLFFFLKERENTKLEDF